MTPRAGMTARIGMAPTIGHELPYVQAVADLLYVVNVAWLRSAVARGLQPPTRALQCEPPWCEHGVVYVRYHGAMHRGRERDYFDGPMMFHFGEGTCIEIAAYDAAASTVLEGRPARPLATGARPDFHCAVRYANGETFDSTGGVQPWR